ncbi:uncharacterized protein J3D65DRAFT_606975 [Phyllosticta citribraziliensis]|uniref:Uncharacterized protein n=1 Tax=Phyllosticta citribraziliensis TaxID=989973 RepID=A0ABR1L7U2_9PEZI
MEQMGPPNSRRDRSTSFILPPARSTPDPLENPASPSPRPYHIERLRDVYENLSCTNEDTDTTADAIALDDLNASQPAPAGPCTNDSSTSTNARNSSEATGTSTSIRSRIGRLFAQVQPSSQSTSRLRLLPNISISRLSFLRRDRGSSSSTSMPNTRIVYSSDGRALFEYDPYTVRGTTPPLAGPFDFSLTSQESRFWRPGQGEQRRLRAGSEGSQWRSQRSPNPGVGPARDDGGLSSYGYEREYGRGYAYGQGQRRGEWGTAAAAAAQREREPNADSSSRPRGESGSGSVQMQSPPRIHGPAPRRRRADSTMTTAMINEESRSGEQPHASSSHVPNRSRSVIPSPSSSVYSDGSGSVDDTCSSMGCPCCSRRNDDEEADKADRANNDDTGGPMVLDGPADDDPTPWPRETRPAPGRTDSYASSLALLRWEASKPGSPYPSPFRPGLATLTLKRQRERREAKQRAQQAAAEEERKTRRRSVSASAALMSAAEEDDDGAYAAALASLDNPRSASASAVLMDGDDADDDGVYAAALANMPVPMFVPPETDEIVVGAIEALREEYEEGARKQRSQRLAKLKQDLQNMKPRARGGADSSAKKKLFRMTW